MIGWMEGKKEGRKEGKKEIIKKGSLINEFKLYVLISHRKKNCMENEFFVLLINSSFSFFFFRNRK